MAEREKSVVERGAPGVLVQIYREILERGYALGSSTAEESLESRFTKLKFYYDNYESTIEEIKALFMSMIDVLTSKSNRELAEGLPDFDFVRRTEDSDIYQQFLKDLVVYRARIHTPIDGDMPEAVRREAILLGRSISFPDAYDVGIPYFRPAPTADYLFAAHIDRKIHLIDPRLAIEAFR